MDSPFLYNLLDNKRSRSCPPQADGWASHACPAREGLPVRLG